MRKICSSARSMPANPGGSLLLTERVALSVHHDRLPRNLYGPDASLLPRSLGGPPIPDHHRARQEGEQGVPRAGGLITPPAE